MASLQIRTLHAYIGMLIAPSLIFFAATGVLQIYSLHEGHPGYTPPALFERLGSLHKDQRLSNERHGPAEDDQPPPARAASAGPGDEEPEKQEPRKSHIATTLLKAFFTAVAAGLIFSVGSGVWMGLQQPRRRRTHGVLLLIGTLVPVVLAVLTG